MCTLLHKPIHDGRTAWKVIEIVNGKALSVCFGKNLIWKIGDNIAKEGEQPITDNSSDQCTIHCFTTRKHARQFKETLTDFYKWGNFKIIKVVIRVNCYSGIIHNTSYWKLDGLPCITGRIAFWNGKFHS